jgi:micrococcal nuclease
MILAIVLVVGCIATEGDSLRCGGERIRLNGVDTPKMGSCQPRYAFAQGDPHASRAT